MNNDDENPWDGRSPIQDHDGNLTGMVTNSEALDVARQLALEVALKRDNPEAVFLAQQKMVEEQREAVAVVNPYFAICLSGALAALSSMLEQLGVPRHEIDNQIEFMLLPPNDID
ncbi:hypothetical protein CH260_10360 [Rhodococcus sp. 05-2256-B2]|uniref:hypothetical protein n=1 Tax=unclassified Rhodococcus (in: high G+C Gram-positive bacteria) TaxID=192944 RepID=UPI000B9A57EE|nr:MULTISPECIES: hypothetical protein [unclassified Rhodococcus (in: high G+C Gram-positive bacteria)]OZD81821.1 hypothetical protein CH258_19820 [Rhodococcus sp. 05-2256-B4]OZD90442.1 hypothetical protein CH257_18215 [Rhodococcus sp. 05-2256-B3]OZD96934.1 hypothetical protein CH260_10360 [Rhodococcus sp. 05-2256-B2]OZE00444.1 hypothetical protein CH285_19465 [Rhodococcus sp. 05-2256-B1]